MRRGSLRAAGAVIQFSMHANGKEFHHERPVAYDSIIGQKLHYSSPPRLAQGFLNRQLCKHPKFSFTTQSDAAFRRFSRFI